MVTSQIALQFREDDGQSDLRCALTWRGFTAEHIDIRASHEYSYALVGSAHYVALHDIVLNDGETRLQDAAPISRLDLRDTLTFVPKGAPVSGWSRLARRQNGFTAVYYDPEIVAEELQGRPALTDGRPMLYFDEPALRATLSKLQAALKATAAVDAVYAETLGLLAILEIDRVQRRVQGPGIPESGGLSTRQERLVRDFVAENLHRAISLQELAEVAQLSRFHFGRACKRSLGLSPHQFVLHCRLEKAKLALQGSDAAVAEVAALAGFSSHAEFSRCFRKANGLTPRQFRRLV